MIKLRLGFASPRMRSSPICLRYIFPGPCRVVWRDTTFAARRRLSARSPTQVRALSTLPDLPVFRAIAGHDPKSTSVVHSTSGRKFTYGNLVSDVLQAQTRLEKIDATWPASQGISGRPVAFLAENSYDYVVTLLSILALDGIAMPLSPSFPVGELDYILDNSQTGFLLATEKYTSKAQDVLDNAGDSPPVLVSFGKRISGGGSVGRVDFRALANPQGGMMLYTSGTTNRPKGVLLPHSALSAQMKSLVDAWEYSPRDRLLHLLPLHHIHGTVNAILAPLLAGSSIEFMFPFNPTETWHRLAAPFLHQKGHSSPRKKPITFLTAVPTIYNRLLATHSTLPKVTQEATRKAITPENLRLNISGSAALPTPTKTAWLNLSNGNVLLERYGMTEVGMALSCGLDFADRVDGSVGWALPSVEIRLWDPDTNTVIEPGEEIGADGRDRAGEIQLRGPTVFKEYWRNAKATKEEFIEDSDGRGSWFRTGDVAIRRHVHAAGNSPQGWARGPMYFIQGRKSVDIIKTGGEKVSALEVERELLSLPQVVEAAVLGLQSDQWGQKVAAVVVLNEEDAKAGGRGGKPWGLMDMRRALKDRLASYKLPQEMKVVPNGLPRNAMGKVNKKQLQKELFGEAMR